MERRKQLVTESILLRPALIGLLAAETLSLPLQAYSGSSLIAVLLNESCWILVADNTIVGRRNGKPRILLESAVRAEESATPNRTESG
jgi:hypothetical protein